MSSEIESLRDEDDDERARAQEALRESEEKYRSLYNNTPVMMHSIDRNGRLISVSDFWLESLGYEREEVLGRASVDFLTAESRIYAQQVVLPSFFRTGLCKDVPYQFVRKNGEIIDVLLSATAEMDAEGKVVRSLAVLIDITERKRAEAALEAQRRFLRQVIDINPHFIFARDRTGHFTLVNQAFARAYGTTVEDLTGRTDADVNRHIDEIARFRREDVEVMNSSSEMVNPEEQITLPDGSKHWLHTIKRPILGPSGRADQVLVVATDITRSKDAEAELARQHASLVELLAKEQASRKLAERLQAGAQVVNESLDLAVVLPAILDQLHEVIEYDSGSIQLIEGDAMRVIAIHGFPASEMGRLRRLEEFPYNQRLASDPEPIVLDDTEALVGSFWRHPLDQPVIRSNIGLPLVVRDRIIGALTIDSHAPNRYTAEDARTAMAFARQAAIAIENARLYTSAQRELTERRRAERALRESEERYRALYEDNPSMYFTVDPRGQTLSVNSFGAAELGYSVDELVGDSVLKVFYGPDRQAATAHVAACLAQPGRVFHWELRKIRKDGSMLWVKETARAGQDARGHAVVFIVCEDITDRKRAEDEQVRLQAAVHASAHEWRLTFDAIATPIVIVDLSGRITRLNQAAAQLAGRRYEELLGLAIGSAALGQPWQRAAELVTFVRATRTGMTCEVRDEREEQIWEVGATLVSAPAPVDQRVIVMARDVTSFVQLQESLRRSETMAAMGTLVAGVAHEVRNPLFGMSATLDAFEARHAVDPATVPYLSVLRGELNRLSGLMRELLEYGRPPSLELASGSVGAVVAEAIESCTSLAEQRRVRVLSLVDEALPPVDMDRGRLVQVFTNLLQNAIEHSPKGGTVVVSAQPINLADRPAVECSVADQGAGFVPEDLSRVFEPFFSRRRGGTGLGLSIVHRIVEQHGGRVEAGNGPQGGALVRVQLPEGARTR